MARPGRFRAPVLILLFSTCAVWGTVIPASAATCRSLGQTMLDLSQAVGDASVNAAKAGNAAEALFGTRRRYGPQFKLVEDSALAVNDATARGWTAIGQLLTEQPQIENRNVAQSTLAVIQEGVAAIKTDATYSAFALVYERAVNRRNRRVARAAIAAALGSWPRTTTAYGMANGTIIGNTFQATTTVTATTADPGSTWRALSADYNALALEDAVSIDSMQNIIVEFQQEVYAMPYSFFPVAQRWVAACRAARQLR